MQRSQQLQMPQTFLTIRTTIYGHEDRESQIWLSAQITATAAAIETLLKAYIDQEGITVEVEILDVIQPKIAPAEANYRWMQCVMDMADSTTAEKVEEWNRTHEKARLKNAEDLEKV